MMKFDHIGIAVVDLETAAKRLEQLGFVRGNEGEVGPEPEQGYPGLNARWVFYGTGDGRPALLLLQPLSETGPVHEFLQQRGEGVQHIAFATDDLPATSSALSERNIQFARPHPFVDSDGNRSHFLSFRDSPGVLIELIEWKK
jgi:methylmalonyl-CoA/ethylmalonyl-CoA epimerase